MSTSAPNGDRLHHRDQPRWEQAVMKPLLRDIGRLAGGARLSKSFLGLNSLDLAEDGRVDGADVAANVVSVFIGIESPNGDASRDTKTQEPPRREVDGRSRANGGAARLRVWSGMILGFDQRRCGIFEAHKAF